MSQTSIPVDENDPLPQFHAWMEDAARHEPNDPNAMALATADSAGHPSVRMVLLKGADERGFVFYTNLESRKGHELAENPHAALCFHWKSLRRQIRVEGGIEPVSDEEADSYYASRPRASQIGAWASRQSQILSNRFELERRIAEFAARFGLGTVPRPSHWSGFRLVPQRIEFWQDRQFRLHDRQVHIRENGQWKTVSLFP
ncbi:pyridoxamine 5'-phosphate oxidase [Magnetospirillum molischianum]|uniref:Pyridoxine/pyridoxamine 5'-phosphate oxidase n=1 Tax=Magnetospirillum molischianum DSM 120 TaxID=1150626 RepID=H8FV35_MAGML|nr:pyridoxamine 5'-phosphate oxidase [Magnetospirillum molischianum]CCG42223.1 pyridoxamine 5'-phosphate oxidase [Magnetospirillum molischianum DSM 120]